MEDIPIGQLGQHAVPLAQAEFGLENVTAKIQIQKMEGKIAHFLELIKK